MQALNCGSKPLQLTLPLPQVRINFFGAPCFLWLPRWRQWLRIHLPMQEMRVPSLGREDPLEKEMVTHSSILAWKITRTEEPNGLYSPWDRKESDVIEATPEASLILRLLSLVVRPTDAPPCLNKGNLSRLRSSSFLHCLVSNYTFLVPKPGRGQGTCLSLSDVFPHPRAWNHERCKPCPKVLSVTYVPPGLWLYPPPLSL